MNFEGLLLDGRMDDWLLMMIIKFKLDVVPFVATRTCRRLERGF